MNPPQKTRKPKEKKDYTYKKFDIKANDYNRLNPRRKNNHKKHQIDFGTLLMNVYKTKQNKNGEVLNAP